MRIPLRYTYATCSVVLATISKGPSGARSGSQTYSPGFRVAVSGETRTPSVNFSADKVNSPSTSRAVARIRNEEDEDFIVVRVCDSSFGRQDKIGIDRKGVGSCDRFGR